MKKNFVAAMAIVFVMSAVYGCSKGYQTEKTSGDVRITLSAARYPLVKGDNTLSIAVTDNGGKAVLDAKVEARYYMPAMPGMAPMEYAALPALKGSMFSFEANIPMEGGWKVDVSVTQSGKPANTATFNLDAR